MKTIKRLFSYVRYDKKNFFIGNLLLVISVGLTMLLPRIGQLIIDRFIAPSQSLGNIDFQGLTKFLILYAVVGFSSSLSNFFAGIRLNRCANYYTEVMRNEVYDHIHSMPVSYFDKVPAGTIVSRITNDTETIRNNFFSNVFAMILTSLVMMIGILIALLFVRWEIALILLAVIPLVVIFKRVYEKHAIKGQHEIRSLAGEVNGQLNEIAKNIQLTQSYGQEEKVRKRFYALTEKQAIAQEKLNRFDWLMFSIPECFFRLVMFMSVTWLVYGHLNLNLPVTAGFIYLIVEYVGALFAPIINILDVLSTIVRSTVAADRVFEVLDSKTEEDGDRLLENTEGRISAKAIRMAYEEGQDVLKDIDFEALPGQSVAIIGPTGSGKSSLINLLFRFYDPYQGEVLIDGENIQQFKRTSLRSPMGIVLQEPFLLEESLYYNIALGNPAISEEVAKDALLRVGGESILSQSNEGMEQKIAERGKNLSSGQRQLISFARALAYNPKILILDEATASIDTETEQIITKAMDVVKEGRTTIIIAHRLSTIRDCDIIYVLVDGEIAEKGNHEELFARRGVYFQMLQEE